MGNFEVIAEFPFHSIADTIFFLNVYMASSFLIRKSILFKLIQYKQKTINEYFVQVVSHRKTTSDCTQASKHYI